MSLTLPEMAEVAVHESSTDLPSTQTRMPSLAAAWNVYVSVAGGSSSPAHRTLNISAGKRVLPA